MPAHEKSDHDREKLSVGEFTIWPLLGYRSEIVGIVWSNVILFAILPA